MLHKNEIVHQTFHRHETRPISWSSIKFTCRAACRAEVPIGLGTNKVSLNYATIKQVLTLSFITLRAARHGTSARHVHGVPCRRVPCRRETRHVRTLLYNRNARSKNILRHFENEKQDIVPGVLYCSTTREEYQLNPL